MVQGSSGPATSQCTSTSTGFSLQLLPGGLGPCSSPGDDSEAAHPSPSTADGTLLLPGGPILPPCPPRSPGVQRAPPLAPRLLASVPLYPHRLL